MILIFWRISQKIWKWNFHGYTHHFQYVSLPRMRSGSPIQILLDLMGVMQSLIGWNLYAKAKNSSPQPIITTLSASFESGMPNTLSAYQRPYWNNAKTVDIISWNILSFVFAYNCGQSADCIISAISFSQPNCILKMWLTLWRVFESH